MKNTLLHLIAMLNFFITIAQPQIQLNNVATGFTLPLFVTHAGDERLFVVEKQGKIKIIMPDGSTNTTPFLDIENIVLASNNVNSERGLLGLAFDPDYKTNGYFYVNYTRESPFNDGATVVARYSVSSNDSNIANVNSAQIILTSRQPFANHNGGCTLFGPDGKLYISLGDGGSANDPQNNAQTDSTKLGKMLRIETDGSIPTDNPFVNDNNYDPAIWATGLRNAWRFSFDKITGDAWIADVGQDAWEEINFQPANSNGGQDYGWRCYEGTVFNSGLCANAIPNRTDPVYVYAHNNSGGYSVTGGYVGRSAKYKGLWGYYLFADAVTQHLWSSENNNGNFTTTKILNGTAGSSNVSFGEDVYGDLYLVKHSSGTIQKIEETGTEQPVAYLFDAPNFFTICEGNDVELSALFHPDLSYQWLKDNVIIPNANSAKYVASKTGIYKVVATLTGNANALPDTSLAVNVEVIPASIEAITQDTLFADVTDSPFIISSIVPNGSFSGTGVEPNGTFTPSQTGVGDYQIIFEYAQNGCSSRDTVLVLVSQTVNVDDKDKANIKLYPNPNKGLFTLSAAVSIQSVEIFDMLGRIILKEKVNTYEANITLTEYSKGLHFVKATTEQGSMMYKILVQ